MQPLCDLAHLHWGGFRVQCIAEYAIHEWSECVISFEVLLFAHRENTPGITGRCPTTSFTTAATAVWEPLDSGVVGASGRHGADLVQKWFRVVVSGAIVGL